jgi:FkbM family methyltransferase
VTFQYLVKNLKKLSHFGVSTMFLPVNAAVSNTTEGLLTIYHRDGFVGASTLLDAGKEFGTPYEVKATTLSKEFASLRIDFIDLLKIDVEGYFMEVLEGITDENYKKIRNIVVECDWIPEGATNHKDVERYLQVKGYNIEMDDPRKKNNVTLYAYR